MGAQFHIFGLRIFAVCAMIVLSCGRAAAFSSGTSAPVLTGPQIFEKVRATYASLPSYSDQGQISTTMDGAVVTTRFATRLARPNLYRIVWEQQSHAPDSSDNTGIQGAWSSGSGDYVQMAQGMRKEYSRDIAFDNVTSAVNGDVANIPKMFYRIQGNDQPPQLTRLADEKVGRTECYQVTGDTASGQTKTYWVGKRDFLIHQIRTDVSPNVMRAALSTATPWSLNPSTSVHAYTSLEIFTNIVLNKHLPPTDFDPAFPLFQQSSY